ncbi:hypothetical protein FGIG_04166, partial [Fasciola gigantica]
PRNTRTTLSFWSFYFEGIHKVIRPQQCYAILDSGKGEQVITSYGFIPGDNLCKKFIYKGSGGNGNRFASVEECERVCLV